MFSKEKIISHKKLLKIMKELYRRSEPYDLELEVLASFTQELLKGVDDNEAMLRALHEWDI